MKKVLSAAIALLSVFLLFGCGQKTRFKVPSTPPDTVLELTLYAFDGKSERVPLLINLGHAFITVKNVTDNNQQIGAYTLRPNEECSIGTWGMNAHWGIWYNVESTYLTLSRYEGRVSVTQGITDSDVSLLNEYIKNNDTWTPFKNCSYFAVDLWNLASDADEFFDLGGLITPDRVTKRIKNTDGYATNRNISEFDAVGYLSSEKSKFTEFVLREE